MNTTYHSKISSEISDVKSDQRRGSKISFQNKRIKANVLVNDLKNLNKFPHRKNYHESPPLSKKSSLAEVSFQDNLNVDEKIQKLQNQFQ